MISDRLREIGTCGGCGIIAQRVISIRGGVPMLRYDGTTATHAAVRVDGEIVPSGRTAAWSKCRGRNSTAHAAKDFFPDRLNLIAGELEEVFAEMGI